MGLFDRVMVDCPKCGKPMEWQSKAGPECYLVMYSLDDAPAEILTDILNDPRYHETCGQWVALIDPQYPPGEKPKPSLTPVKVRPPETPEGDGKYKWWPDGVSFGYGDLEEPLRWQRLIARARNALGLDP